MAARNFEHKVIQHKRQQICTVVTCQGIFLIALVIGLGSHGVLFAQAMPSEKLRGTEFGWQLPQGDDDAYGQVNDQAAFALNQPFTVNRRYSGSLIVTLHELQHHVPGQATKEYERAIKAKDKGDDEAAVGYFKKAIAVDPEFCDAFNGLGATYLRLNRVDLATEQFNNAIAIDPHGAMGYSNLALAYLTQKQYVDAERAARRAIDLDRGATHGLLMLGVSLLLEGKFTAEAERSLRCAVSDFPQANVWHAVLLAAQGDLAHAKEQLSAYIGHADQAGANTAAKILHRLESVGRK